MRGELLANLMRSKGRGVRDDAECTRIGALAHPPDVQVRNVCFTGIWPGFNGFSNFCHHRVVHFPIQQHLARFDQELLRPDCHQHSADDAHHRVQPGPAVKPAACERHDRQHRGSGVGHDMQISRFEVEVVVMGMVVAVIHITARVPRSAAWLPSSKMWSWVHADRSWVCIARSLLQIFGDFLEFSDTFIRVAGAFVDRLLQAVIDVVVDEARLALPMAFSTA